MSVIALILVLALIGLVAWAVVKFIPMPPAIQTIIYVVTAIVCLLYALHAFGFIQGVGNVQVPKIG